MKKTIQLLVAVLFTITLMTATAGAKPKPKPTPTPAPINNGIALLVVAGVAIGVTAAYKFKAVPSQA